MVRAGSLAVIRLSLMRRRRRRAAGEGCPPRRGGRAPRPSPPLPRAARSCEGGVKARGEGRTETHSSDVRAAAQRPDLQPGCTPLCDCRPLGLPLWAYALLGGESEG